MPFLKSARQFEILLNIFKKRIGQSVKKTASGCF